MRCTQYREALSARLDGEPTGLADDRADGRADGVAADLVDRHLADCRDCARWWEDAVRLHRMTRIAPADPVPDLTPRLIPTALRVRRQPSFTTMLARAGLAAVGIVQLAWALAALFGETDSMNSPRHVMHEFAAWNAGIAVGFLAVVLRTRLAPGLLPALGAFVALLIGVCVVDFSTGHVNVERIMSHLLVLAGVLLLAVLTWSQRGPRPGWGGRRTRRGVRPIGAFAGGVGRRRQVASRSGARRDVAGAA